jgi:putative peptidoglycan lipid II flippase
MKYWHSMAMMRTRLRSLILREYSIPEASTLFMAAFLISAALGIVRQVLFNAEFGAASEASAFYAAFRLPDTLTNLIAGGTLAGAVIPVLAGVRHAEDQAAEWRVACLVMATVSALVALIVVLGLLFAPIFVQSVLAPGFDPTTSALTITLTRIMLLQAILSVISSILIAVLSNRNQFTMIAIAIIVHNFAMISGIIVVRILPGLGILGPTFGVLADALLQLGIVLIGIRANQLRLRWVWNLSDRRLREVAQLLIPGGLSSAVNYAGTIVDTAFGSFAREAATLPALQSAHLLIGLPTRLFGTAIGQAMYPRLAGHAAHREWHHLRQTLLRTLGIALLLAVPVIVAFHWFGRDLVRLLFERGRFTSQNGDITFALLLAYVAGLPAYIATDLLNRGFGALRDTLTPLLTNCGQLAGRIIIISQLIEPWGAVAIPFAFAASSIAEACILGSVLAWRLWLTRRR